MARRRRQHPTEPVAAGPTGVPGDGAAGDALPSPGRQRAAPRTRAATVWASLIFALVLLIVILIFIFQNLQSARVSFVSLHGRFPLGLALLFAAVLGALFAVCLGVVRIVQLRLVARRNLRAPAQPTSTRTK